MESACYVFHILFIIFILINLMCLIDKQLLGKVRDTLVTELLLVEILFQFCPLIFICRKLILSIIFGVS